MALDIKIYIKIRPLKSDVTSSNKGGVRDQKCICVIAKDRVVSSDGANASRLSLKFSQPMMLSLVYRVLLAQFQTT